MREHILLQKIKKRYQRKARVRGKIFGEAAKPRVSVFKSNKFIYAQAIDDTKGHTLVAVDGRVKKFASNIKGASEAGKDFAASLKSAKISEIVFDRNGYLYHGVVKSFCDSLRENGIKF